MDDLISKKWLMECVDEGWIKFDTEKDTNTYIHLVRDIAPSAQPERKRGKWKNNSPVTVRCSVCNHVVADYHASDYCPNCGADMREVADGNTD